MSEWLHCMVHRRYKVIEPTKIKEPNEIKKDIQVINALKVVDAVQGMYCTHAFSTIVSWKKRK